MHWKEEKIPDGNKESTDKKFGTVSLSLVIYASLVWSESKELYKAIYSTFDS